MDRQTPSLGEAASSFLAELSLEKRGISQQKVYRFVRWYGWERPIGGLRAPEIAKYAEQLSRSDTDYIKKLELIRAFLVYAKNEKWTGTNLAVHLKARKGKSSLPRSNRRGSAETVPLTRQGYADLEADLAALKVKRPGIIDEITKAAADKDFRENAPLEAARQQYGYLEGRIRGLEGTLKSAIIIDEKGKNTPRVSVGDTLILRDLASGEELRYTLVSPREVNPTKGKISNMSPIGKAIDGQNQGEVVEVTTPAGKIRYEIKKIER